ncbi:hypothetical protein K439DRAFT_429592 [Ramaria rubella]|nr:hypothetical protein K439DRAFT_429592 [Ramaria rubella]
MDATTVKTEIKSWEHDFRLQHGRNATVEDIKAQPAVAEKYKLYKKLTKEADHSKEKTKTSQAQISEPPRTPPPRTRHNHRTSQVASAAILPKSRPVTSSSDTTTKNPFSPVKKAQSISAKASSSTLNPFLTPIKVRKRTPSPDPFSLNGNDPPRNPAVEKARKRLRGESVSPSPLPSEKRHRTNGLAPPRPDLLHARSASPPNDKAEEGDSFVDDSPVKAPAGGKAFKPLFEEAMSLSQPVPLKGSTITRGRTFSKAKTMPSGLFGSTKKAPKSRTPDIAEDFLSGELIAKGAPGKMNGLEKGKEEEKSLGGAQKVKKRRVLPGPKGLIPGKDDLFENPPPAATMSQTNGGSRKRTLSKIAEDDNTVSRPVSKGWSLLPPSPPPQQDVAGQYNPKGKGKGKARGPPQKKSKRSRLSAEDPDDDEDMDDDTSPESAEAVAVKIVPWYGRAKEPQDEAGMELIVDPELQRLHLHAGATNNPTRSMLPSIERFEVDLPEEMRRTLALSPRDMDREKEEEDLVKGLMQGRRKPGGEVWGPGELGGESEASDESVVKKAEEDDWEGEGVPWEVAEL